jgi:ATP-dependent Clp protease ATP-binding subunit ClpA
MSDISQRMEEMGFTVELSEAAAHHLGEIGYDPSYGARPLRRLLQRRVENELSKRILKGEYATGDHVVVDYDPDLEGENKLTFTKVDVEPILVDLPINSDQGAGANNA